MPTILADTTPDMLVCRKEVFGPVVAIQAYDHVDDALKLANDTEYGLQAAIFTQNLTTALRAVRTLDFGGVLVNEVPTWRADQMPYGGVRDSGNTREGPGLRRPGDDRATPRHHQPLKRGSDALFRPLRSLTRVSTRGDLDDAALVADPVLVLQQTLVELAGGMAR